MKAASISPVFFALALAAEAGAQGTNMPMNPAPAKPAPAASSAALPLVDGEIRKIDRDKGVVVLRHGDVPNIAMPAMTMGYDIADRRLLEGLKVGDKVKFQAEMVKGKATVTQLRSVR